MQLVFVSNYFNHHQQPVSDRFYERCRQSNGSYTFIQTEKMEEERVSMGWGDALEHKPYVKNYWQEPQACQKLIDEADAVIFGGTDEECYIQNRLKSGKLIIRYSERLYKTGRYKFISPRGLRKKFLDHTRYMFGNVYLLCSGAYVAGDFRLVLAYPFKKLKYGYFPAFQKQDIDALMAAKARNQKKPTELMWAARMIDWKHPEVVVEIAEALKQKGYSFHITMVGDGYMYEEVKTLAQKKQVMDVLSFLGSQNPKQVRTWMEGTDIYLATSDRQEGWGAVINEAMNSGCAVVANKAMGAAPYLIKHGKNGYLYSDSKAAISYIEALLDDAAQCERVGRAAYDTIQTEWNAEVAADRTYQLIEELLAGKRTTTYQTGPLSKV